MGSGPQNLGVLCPLSIFAHMGKTESVKYIHTIFVPFRMALCIMSEHEDCYDNVKLTLEDRECLKKFCILLRSWVSYVIAAEQIELILVLSASVIL